VRVRTLITAALLLAFAACVPAVRVQPKPTEAVVALAAVPAAAAPAPAPVQAQPSPEPPSPVAGQAAPPAQEATAPAPLKVDQQAPARQPTPAGQPVTPNRTTPDRPAAARVEPPVAELPKVPPVPRLAILVYHDVDDTNPSAFTVSVAQLEAQVQMLKEEGYAFYRLADVEKLLADAPGMPEKGVMLVFDDGYQSFATRVLPVAKKYGVPAVCFVVTKYMDFDMIFGRPHMSQVELKQVAESGLLELAGHSYYGHRTAETEDGTWQPVLTHRIRKPQSTLYETPEEYAQRVRDDFEQTANVLRELGAGIGERHYTFPFTARSDEAVALGRLAGFRYFYVGGEQLVRPDTDPGAIPRVHAGAPEITAEVLRTRLRNLFAEP